MPYRLTLVRSLLQGATGRRGVESLDPRVADALADPCWLYDPHAERFDFVNAAYAQRWGGADEEGGLTVERWLDRVHADDRAAVQRALRRLACGEGYSIEYRAVDRSGAALWIGEDARFVDAPGQVVVGVSRDITARKGRELALQDEVRRKDEFLAVLMHELRTPLQAISAAGAVLPQEQAYSARIIERQVKHLSRLVDDLGESTRLTHRKVHLQLETVDLRGVVHEAIDAVRAGLDARKVELRLAVSDGDVCVRADPSRLSQVFNNLLHNAVKFSPVGGCVEVCITRSIRADEATVSISDEGVGIEPGALDSVFDLFVQEAAAPARLRGGLGIGLSVVRRLVELHGGRVSAHSDGRGSGSRFEVTLPALTPSGAGLPQRILVVEDNVDAATSLQQMLQLDGHAVVVAVDGRTGLREALRWRPDTVMLDLQLPDLDGCEVARLIRATAAGYRPRLVALSGSAALDRPALCDAGFDDCLTKPAQPSEMAAALCACPGRYEGARFGPPPPAAQAPGP